MKQFIYPYLMMKNTKEVAEYYKEMFQGEIVYMMLGKDSPDCPEEELEEVYHLQLKFNDNQIYMAEAHGETVGDAIHIHLDYDNKYDMAEVFNRLRKEGEVIQELGETFWGAYFGTLKDKYGVVWQFHHSIPEE